MGILRVRDYCYYYYDDDCNSAWHSWGRWVAFGVIVAAAVIIFFVIACINARRRRNRGLRPITGTAWMAPPPPYQQNPYPGPYYQQQQPPPPPQYSAQPQNYGYFGGQQTGIELQQPQNVHYGVERSDQPPTGAPPNVK